MIWRWMIANVCETLRWKDEAWKYISPEIKEERKSEREGFSTFFGKREVERSHKGEFKIGEGVTWLKTWRKWDGRLLHHNASAITKLRSLAKCPLTLEITQFVPTFTFCSRLEVSYSYSPGEANQIAAYQWCCGLKKAFLPSLAILRNNKWL